MSQNNPQQGKPLTIFCTRCGKLMSVAHEHVYTAVACPHCGENLEPWRVMGISPAPGGQAPPPPPQQPGMTVPPLVPVPGYPYPYGNYSYRSRVVAGLLGIFLGGFGVHRFYLGFVGIGILQIFVTICSGGIGAAWGFIEGILCFTGHLRDVDDLPLRE